MTWMLRLLFSQPSPGKTAFLIAPKEISPVLSKGSLKHLKKSLKIQLWQLSHLGSCKYCAEYLIPTAKRMENECATLPTAGASGSTAIFTITSTDRTATVPFCRRNWETTISSGCVTYKNPVGCLRSWEADVVSLPRRMLPFASPRADGLPLLWGSLPLFWWSTVHSLTSFSLLHVMFAVGVNSRAVFPVFGALSTRALRSVSSRPRTLGMKGRGIFCSGCMGARAKPARGRAEETDLRGWCQPWSQFPSRLLLPQPLWVSSEVFFQLEPDYFIMSSVWKNLRRGQPLIPKSFQKC